MKGFSAEVKARTLEFIRDKRSLSWNLLLPIVLVLGLAFASSSPSDSLFKVGVIGPGDPALAFLKTPQMQFITSDPSEPPAKVLSRLRQNQLDAVIDTNTRVYWINDQGKNARLMELLVTKQEGAAKYIRQWVSGPPSRSIDWLVPGIIATNLMFCCLWGLGPALVRSRKNGILRSLKPAASLLSFPAALGLSRFLIALAASVVLWIASDLFLHFRMQGSYFDLLFVVCLGALSMVALALAFASRLRNEELAAGLLKLILLVMTLLSGAFFSLEGTPGALQMAAQVFPLTHFIQAARAVMLDGSGLFQVWGDVLFLGVFTAGCLGIAVWLFKWE